MSARRARLAAADRASARRTPGPAPLAPAATRAPVPSPDGFADRLDPVMAALALIALALGGLGVVIFIRSSAHDGGSRSTPLRRTGRLTTVLVGVGVGVAAAALVIAAGSLTG